MKSGAPDEPDTSDWNAICATPSPSTFFAVLFHEVAGFSLPEAVITDEQEDDVRRIQTGRRGSKALGAEIVQISCTETSDLPTHCTWETRGLPGMKVKWAYDLEYAGQLGHAAFRHVSLECEFDDPGDERRFSEIWCRIIGKEPVFEPADNRL